MRQYLTCTLSILSLLAYGQMDTTLLPEVDLQANQLRESEGAIKVRVDSSMQVGYFRLAESITAELPVYVKSYGPSAVATFSVRGTGAQHTEVLWNGMSVNSSMLGLFDLNLVSPSAFDQIDFLYGGASMSSGVSSFGGALNLSNKARFDEHFELGLLQAYGSYRTNHTDFDFSASNGNVFWRTRLLWDYSLNDFEYTNPRLSNSPTFVNEHAKVNQNQWVQDLGVRLNERNELIGHLWLQQGTRQLPPVMSIYSDPDPLGRSTQKDVQQRFQLEWNYSGAMLESQLKAGFSNWAIDFNEDQTIAQTTQGQWKTVIPLDSLTRIETLVQYVYETGKAESYPGDGLCDRSRASAVLSASRQWQSFFGELQLKQERVQDDWAPFQYQLGGRVHYGKRKQWSTRFRTAVQARFPTLNDLFWGVDAQQVLSPEKSFQNEISQEVRFSWLETAFTFRLAGYNNHIENYILWLPQTDLSWRATNVTLVEIKGAELELSAQRAIGPGLLEVKGSYSYTSSLDQAGKQLIFIPLHQARARGVYSWSRVVVSLNFVFQGLVYTDRENEFYMPWYQTADLRVSYSWKWGRHHLAAFVQSANVTDVVYQSIPLRPMPGRTIQIGAQWRFATE